jgi:hypothetical protein
MNSVDDTIKDTTKTVTSKNVSLFLLDDHHQNNTSNERLEDEEDDLIEQMPIIDDEILLNDESTCSKNENYDDVSNANSKNFRQLIQVELESLHHNQNLHGGSKASTATTTNTMLSSPESAMPSGDTQDISFQDAQDTDLDVIDFNSKSPPLTKINNEHRNNNQASLLGEMVISDKMKELEKKNKHLQATLERIYEKDDLFMASSRRENEERENSIKLLQNDIEHLNNEKNSLQMSNQNLAGLLSKALLMSSSIEENINKRLARIIQSQSYSNNGNAGFGKI